MSTPEADVPISTGNTPLRALARASRELALQADPLQALWSLIVALREDLGVDRAGVFAFDTHSNTLEHLVGVDGNGQPEFGVEQFTLDAGITPMMQVARRDLPFYLSNDAPRDYPDSRFAVGVRALAVIPIVAGDRLVGLLCADNCLTGSPIPQELLDPFFLYAGLAALPLFARYHHRENERVEATRQRIHREVLYAVTSGKIQLCDRSEILAEWPTLDETIPVEQEQDVRAVREAVRKVAVQAGMSGDRAADLGLCASEAATNALIHGDGGQACVGCRDGRLRVRVVDFGCGIDPDDLSRATLLKGWSKRASMGLGFTVINETADRLYLYTGPDGTTVLIEMAVEPEINLPDECNPLLWGEELTL